MCELEMHCYLKKEKSFLHGCYVLQQFIFQNNILVWPNNHLFYLSVTRMSLSA